MQFTLPFFPAHCLPVGVFQCFASVKAFHHFFFPLLGSITASDDQVSVGSFSKAPSRFHFSGWSGQRWVLLLGPITLPLQSGHWDNQSVCRHYIVPADLDWGLEQLLPLFGQIGFLVIFVPYIKSGGDPFRVLFGMSPFNLGSIASVPYWRSTIRGSLFSYINWLSLLY